MSITCSNVGKKTYKIVFLGDSSTGKTAIIDRFINNKYSQKENPTIGIDFLGKNVIHNNIACRLQLWDTAGQQRYKSLIPSYLKDAICAIFVFDVHRPQTLLNLNNWIKLFKENRSDKTVMILCGNKTDLQSNYSQEELIKLKQKYNMTFCETSAKQGKHVDDMFFHIIEQINGLQNSKKKKIIVEQEDIMPPLTTEALTRAKDQGQLCEEEKQGKKIKVKKVQLIKSEKSSCCGGFCSRSDNL